MKVFCPECNTSVAVEDGERILDCPSCSLRANLSEIGTSPGVAAATVTRDMTGESFGGYRLESLIGMGGMGIVYKARRESDGEECARGEEVALKVLACDSVWKKDAFVKRFEREIKALSRLEHPNIVRFLGSGRQGEDYFLVTEYVRGENLAERMKRGPLESEESVRVMVGVLHALAYAHENGVVHRDIKPANILLSDNGVKVLDFGLAQISGLETALTTLTRTDLAMGTFNYLSPEQRISAKHVDARSDLFSIGVVLFEMLTGTLPVGNFQLPSRTDTSIDKRFDGIISTSLASDPDARYQTAAAFVDEIVKLRRRRSPYSMVVVAAILFTAGALGVFIARSSGGERDTVEVNATVKRGSAVDSKSDIVKTEKVPVETQAVTALPNAVINNPVAVGKPPPTPLTEIAELPKTRARRKTVSKKTKSLDIYAKKQMLSEKANKLNRTDVKARNTKPSKSDIGKKRKTKSVGKQASSNRK